MVTLKCILYISTQLLREFLSKIIKLGFSFHQKNLVFEDGSIGMQYSDINHRDVLMIRHSMGNLQ